MVAAKLLLAGAAVAGSLAAQDHSMRPLRIAQAALAASTAADIASSWGRQELNPALGRGEFGMRQAGTIIGMSATIALSTELVARKWPTSQRAMAWINWISVGQHGAAVTINLSRR